MEETKKQLKCPLCSSTEFQDEKGRLESQWGLSEHKVDMVICKQCGHVMLFSQGRTWWQWE